MKKILIVDDSQTIREQLKTAFAEKPEFELVEAENGIDGLKKLESNSDVKLIISDVNMPEMDGITMIKKITALGTFQSVPIIMITTEVNQDLKNVAKENGVKAWIVKPFVPEKLIVAAETLIK